MTLLRSIAFALFAILAMADAGFAASASEGHLEIRTATGSHGFDIEVMRSEAELEKGLMFRRQMDADKGMLFDFGAPQQVSMWMKNTYLPLDMVFIARNGAVVAVKQNAEPMSEAIISSGRPVTGVLELNAGTAKRIGLKVGDEVRHPMFKP